MSDFKVIIDQVSQLDLFIEQMEGSKREGALFSWSVSNITFPFKRHFEEVKGVSTDFSNCDFAEVSFTSSEFVNCHFNRVDWNGASFRRTKFINCIFNDVDWSQCDFTHTWFSTSTFYNVNMDGAIIQNAIFSYPKGLRTIAGIGHSERTILAIVQPEPGNVLIQAGCFWGTPAEMRDSIKDDYSIIGNSAGQDYLDAVTLIENWANRVEPDIRAKINS